ncbi:MAG: tetratricopeptide repeat protein, partial [Flavobacteriales bacterium]|nr:tetratricopeptide repeat protein [Flavobacteriales bacterium]
MLKNIISILIILSTISLFANGKVDSLVKFIDNNKNEEKVDALLKLSEAYFSSDFSKSISLSKEALALSEKLNYQLGIAVSNNNIGYTLTDLGNFQEALNHYQISIELFKKLGEQNKEAIAYNDIAYIYQSQGLVEKAIENYIKSLKLLEEIGDKASLGACLNNIGLLYHDQKNYEKALEYYLNGLKVKEELGDEKSIAVSLNNIGSVYFSQEQYYEAKEYFFKSLFKRKKVNDKPGIAQSLINISGIYREQKQYDKALEYLLQSKDIQEEINNNVGLVDVLQNIGVIYNIKGDYEKAQIYLEKAYNIAKTIGSPELIKNTSLSLSNYYRNIKLFEKAYRLIVEHHKMSDSINNIENVQKIIQVGLQYEFEKKLHKADIEQLQKNHQHEIAIKEQKMISYSFGIGLLALIILSIVILKSLIDKKKANIRILEQKKEIEVKSVKLEESLISITDSINYAKRIQEALLQTERNISEHMTPHFIFFKPKDIVSGDFYWSFEDNNT